VPIYEHEGYGFIGIPYTAPAWLTSTVDIRPVTIRTGSGRRTLTQAEVDALMPEIVQEVQRLYPADLYPESKIAASMLNGGQAKLPHWPGIRENRRRLAMVIVGVLAAVVGLCLVIDERRRYRFCTAVLQTKCPRCRYNMKGIPGGICPECGDDYYAGGVVHYRARQT